MSKRKAKAETLPPEGYVQALPVVEHPDTIAEGVPVVTLKADSFPAVIRALNLIREDNGGPSWPPEAEPEVPAAWVDHLPMVEGTLALLSDTDPAPEDLEALERIAAGEAPSFLDSALYTFCNGEHTVVKAMKKHNPALTLAHAFLNDFFNGWTDGVPA